jgi:hypothetical protein
VLSANPARAVVNISLFFIFFPLLLLLIIIY